MFVGRYPRKAVAALVILAAIVAVASVALVRATAADAETYNAPISGFREDDPYRLVAYVSLGYADPVVSYDAREEAGRVVITVHAQRRNFGPGTFKQLTASLATPVLMTLHDRLGDRVLVDERGATIPRTAQDPLCPRSP